MSKFIVVTDTRESVGIEKIRGRKTFLNVDHIVSFEPVEPQIVEEIGYKTVIVTTIGNYFVSESIDEVILSIITDLKF